MQTPSETVVAIRRRAGYPAASNSMMEHISTPEQAIVASLYREESGRILASLIRLLSDFDLAEEAMHEAFAEAIKVWPQCGVPERPRSWLISTARFKAIDAVRRRKRWSHMPNEALDQFAATTTDDSAWSEDLPDDRLRLIFTCCHPSLSPEGQVALTLREVCGLTTEEIAEAFLLAPVTLAQRIVRTKATIRGKQLPYVVPELQELPARLSPVLQVVYLIFHRGYSAEEARRKMCDEAVRLGRLLWALLPEPEVAGLLALMLLQDSRRDARTDAQGKLILLSDQDRSLWNQQKISEGISLAEQALASHRFGAYTLQAAIAAVHAEAATAQETDWAQIIRLYDCLFSLQPSSVIELNRAVAVAMCHGPSFGLPLIERLLTRKEMQRYHLAYAAHADLCRQLGRLSDARHSYETALSLATDITERSFLAERLSSLK